MPNVIGLRNADCQKHSVHSRECCISNSGKQKKDKLTTQYNIHCKGRFAPLISTIRPPHPITLPPLSEGHSFPTCRGFHTPGSTPHTKIIPTPLNFPPTPANNNSINLTTTGATKQMTTFLSLSTGTNGAATAAQRVAPISGTTPARSRVRQNLGGLSQAYHALSMTQKGGWQTVANTLNAQQNRVGRHKLSAANAFVTLNSALLASGGYVQATAPANLAAPPILPPVTVQSSGPATAGDTSTLFSLTLHCIGYENALCVLAAPPSPAGKTTFPDTDFKVIGALDELGPDGTDITVMYKSVFGAPPPGAQVALKLIGTSNAGIRLSPLVVMGIVSQTAAEPGKKAPLHIG